MKIIITIFFLINFLYSTITELANKYYNKNDFKKAEYLYKKALDQGENKAIIYYNLANLYYLQTNIGKSIDFYKKVINYAPNFKDSYLNIAKIFYSFENYYDSIVIIKDYIKLNNSDPEAFIMLGDIYKKIRSFGKADYYYLKSISLNKTNEDAYISYASLYIDLKDYDKAFDIIETGLLNIENSFNLLKLESDIYKLKGKYSDAAIILQFILNKIKTIKNQDKITIYNELSELLLQAGYLNSAIEILKKSILLNPDNINTLLHLDLIYFDNKKYNEALNFYFKLFEINKIEAYKLIKKILIYAYNEDDKLISSIILKFYKTKNISDNISNLYNVKNY